MALNNTPKLDAESNLHRASTAEARKFVQGAAETVPADSADYVQINFRVPTDIRDEIERVAMEKGRTIRRKKSRQEMIFEWCLEGIKRHDNGED